MSINLIFSGRNGQSETTFNATSSFYTLAAFVTCQRLLGCLSLEDQTLMIILASGTSSSIDTSNLRTRRQCTLSEHFSHLVSVFLKRQFMFSVVMAGTKT